MYKRVFVDSVSLPLQLGFMRLYKGMSPQVAGFVDIIHSDQVARTGELLDFSYGCNQPDYNFKIGLVLLVPGIYSLTVHERRFSNCITYTPNSFAQIFYKFDVKDSNKDVFLSIPKISRGGLGTEKMDAKEEFIIQVDE
ncbi:hypothetical protein MKJ04_12910 [Pontibacter sp. E15-1]|uniref:hypothetical protein n=1 Tax=Pontibacter sp. E15-1 TaxID=2919918 RepID=UPI001F5023ED|nr:hypothetical protein [Pontibacter sp. E15-1]MCJ8165746.1 hypothetical protein [Pontibacter sp. E15-1]